MPTLTLLPSEDSISIKNLFSSNKDNFRVFQVLPTMNNLPIKKKQRNGPNLSLENL